MKNAEGQPEEIRTGRGLSTTVSGGLKLLEPSNDFHLLDYWFFSKYTDLGEWFLK